MSPRAQGPGLPARPRVSQATSRGAPIGRQGLVKPDRGLEASLLLRLPCALHEHCLPVALLTLLSGICFSAQLPRPPRPLSVVVGLCSLHQKPVRLISPSRGPSLVFISFSPFSISALTFLFLAILKLTALWLENVVSFLVLCFFVLLFRHMEPILFSFNLPSYFVLFVLFCDFFPRLLLLFLDFRSFSISLLLVRKLCPAPGVLLQHVHVHFALCPHLRSRVSRQHVSPCTVCLRLRWVSPSHGRCCTVAVCSDC